GTRKMQLTQVLTYAMRRLLQAVPVVILIMVGTFLLLKLAPGDTVDALVGDMGGADAAYIARLRAEYGLDQPVWVQLGRYMAKLIQFDFGWSFVYEQPVSAILWERLGTTLMLMGTSLSLAFSIGVGLGAIAARRAYSLTDNAISTLGLVFYATPSFFLSLMMILLFSVKLGWLPVGGLTDVAGFYTGWDHVLDVALHLIMPTAALSLIYLSFYLRLMRASVLEVADLDFVRTARAKGAGETRLMVHHIMRNALLPVVTLLGLQFSTVLGGSVVVETIFALPGLGQLAYQSVIQRDMNMLMGIIFLCAIIVVIVNFLTDLLYARLDSRIALK
ncbi:ABC transporter permease, partial [Rhodovulum sulfidophilum]|nr:ABC transporter permease [Rhodovulum sulfidophilum]